MAQNTQNASQNEGAGSSADALRRLLTLRPYLMAFIFSMVRDFAIAERVYQDVCVEVGESWASSGADDFGLWVRAVARNRTLAFLKARDESGAAVPSAELVQEFENVIADMMTSPEERWNKRKEALRACLKELPSQLRRIVDLRYLKDLSIDAIAERIGEKEEEVAEALNHARGELLVCLKRRLGEAS